ncbi:cytochrome C biogenesis protein ResB [Berryella intestinalis]|uniref:Cytochrome C biogenesis protein ResB n=1 Tax=Berryella intestinalis TaxID=1531429 RepID=A0A0A8BBS2_9ACTN|nr:cytochrome c biogenesis protein CcdA [Berryella intestinalis]AJC12567.1 cytochrome C biogenesis protein ResB [Berryella intestinalis]
MDYIATFLEGILTFVSPCLLPMLPLYLAYFAGSSAESSETGSAASSGASRATKTTVVNALGFILGFTLVFVALGALAGGLGGVLIRHATWVNVICGLIVILFGLNFAGVIRIPFLEGTHRLSTKVTLVSFPSAILFGIVFSLGWTPCVGAYLGSALALASTQGSVMQGITLLLAYSAGLGVPFLISALAIDKLSGAFSFIKRNYRIINLVCGVFLIVMGVLMITGQLTALMSILNP